MEYSEIVTKLLHKEQVSADDVTGLQIFRLIFDRVIPGIQQGGFIYEVHFARFDEANGFMTIDVEKECATVDGVKALFRLFVHYYNAGEALYIKNYDGHCYEVTLDVLETPE